jgi:protein-S-isoprenylcysteine O-methyltransferase Ste14
MFGTWDTSVASLLLRAWLLGGLVFHKAVWEYLKRGGRRPPAPARLAAVKAAKLAVLGGIIVQTLVPMDLLPLADNPTVLRWAGAILFTLGVATAVSARMALGRNWSDIEVAQVKSDHAVVANGIYRYIRHPIYAGDLALLAGLELALNSWLVAGVAALALVVARKAAGEETALARSLPQYALYSQQTKRFIPFVY